MKNREKKGIIFAISASLIGHILFFLIFFMPHSLNSRTDRKERVIVTRLVAIGVPRSEKILPRVSGNPVEPAKEVIINPEINNNSIEKNAKKEEKRRGEEFSKKILSSINKVRKMVDAKDHSPPIGDPNGSPYGDSTEGQEGDIYLTEIYNRIKGNYIIPEIISEKERKELRAIVVIYIDSNGKLIKYEFERRSGNPHFDNALINAINRSSPFKPPPKERAKIYKTEGIGINFTIE
ncbi:MAG: energy transducer TonB [Myxococcota bacterium]